MSTSEFYEEIGRLRQRIEDLGGANGRLREMNETLDEANIAMHDELAKANRALKRDEKEKDRLHNDIRRLNEELETQNQEIESLHNQLAKAQRTIKVQSDQIATPSERKAPWASTHATPPSRQIVDYRQPPPQFSIPQHRPTSAYQQPQSSHSGYAPPPPPPARSTAYPHASPQSSSISHFSFPLFQYPSSRPSERRYQYPDPEDRSQRAAMPIRQPSIPPSMTIEGPNPNLGGPVGRVRRLQDWRSREKEVYEPNIPAGTMTSTRRGQEVSSLVHDLSPLFLLVEGWARRYCSVPSRTGDAALPSNTKDQIASRTNPAEVQNLLSQGSTRPLVVAKLINHEITTTCLRPPFVISGFRPSIDTRLEAILGQDSAALALNIRRGLFVAAAETVQDAIQSHGPRFESWVDRQANLYTAMTWTSIAGLCVADTNKSEAKRALKEIWLDAYRVGVKMACKPSIFTTEFPPTGPRSVFNPANMVNKDHSYGSGSGAELARRGATVKLAVTPVVMETDYSGRDGGDRLQSRCLHFSNCLLNEE